MPLRGVLIEEPEGDLANYGLIIYGKQIYCLCKFLVKQNNFKAETERLRWLLVIKKKKICGRTIYRKQSNKRETKQIRKSLIWAWKVAVLPTKLWISAELKRAHKRNRPRNEATPPCTFVGTETPASAWKISSSLSKSVIFLQYHAIKLINVYFTESTIWLFVT